MNIDYITPIKSELDEQMNNVCCLFMLIGTPLETPRYYNLSDFDADTKVLTIGSTQSTSLFFQIHTPFKFNHINTQEFWNQFKEYRTNFLLTNYPTINAY